MPENRWDEEAARALQGVDALVYRSRLLGSDRTVCNWGGGNTSLKTVESDHRGRPVPVLWVKGSGSDLASATAASFTALFLEEIAPLQQRPRMSDDEMVAYLTRCMLDSRHPRMSIETLLHAFLPYPHVDHTHPDAIISLCCASNGREAAREIWGDTFVWASYIRPGFSLSKIIADSVRDNPRAQLVLMEKHGLVTWGETSEACYAKTIETISAAEEYLSSRAATRASGRFGSLVRPPLPPDERRTVAAAIVPELRGALSGNGRAIVAFDDSADILEFVGSADAPALAEVGAACPDHLVHTKRTPLLVDWDPKTADIGALRTKLADGAERYSAEYRRYFDQNAEAGDKISSPAPRIVLVPGVGMFATGKTKAQAQIAAGLYRRAVAVMAGSVAIGEFVSLSPAESFAVEYWPLELYKLSLAPPEAEFSRRVALITGGGGGIGSETARRLASAGAHIVLADLDLGSAQRAADDIVAQFGAARAVAVRMDVTSEASVIEAFEAAALEYGGVDILVNNAGIASSSAIDETSLESWQRNIDVLATGYFLAAREAFRIMKRQKLGGTIVFVTSKNAVYAGKNAAAYSAAKAAELHLARCLAAEGGEFGIRVNSVLPDAVLQGSAIWNSAWRAERAAAYGVAPDQLEEYYRKRTVLHVDVTPSDIAESIAFLACERSSRTTGCAITVDGGVAAAFLR